MPITQKHGVHIDIPQLPRLAPLRSAKDYNDFLARLTAYPRQVDQVIELMRRGIAAGWMPPAEPIRQVLPQIEKQIVDDVTKSPLYKPFENLPDAVRRRRALGARGPGEGGDLRNRSSPR